MPPQHLPAPGAARASFTLLALTNTGSLWGYAAGLNGVPPPALVGTTVAWGRPAPLLPGAALRQPGGGADLAAGGGAPEGFWTGGVSIWGLRAGNCAACALAMFPVCAPKL